MFKGANGMAGLMKQANQMQMKMKKPRAAATSRQAQPAVGVCRGAAGRRL